MVSIKTLLGEEKYRRIKNNIKLKYQRQWLMKIYRDSSLNNAVPLNNKIWAYRKGFLSRRIDQLGLNSKNISTFLSDYDYMKLAQINGRFVFWIDDKLTTKYVLAKFNENLPEYYFYLSNRNASGVSKLMDCPDELTSDIESILRLLETKGNLALRPVSGAFGRGFIKIGFKSPSYMINDKDADEMGIRKLLMSVEDYIVTEYVEMHEELKRVYPCSLNTIRLLVINENGNDPFIGVAGIKFGTKRSGFVDNVSSGGISCWIDPETGCFSGGFGVSEKKEFVDHVVHPDTGLTLEGTIPNWQKVKEGILKICKYISLIEFMGFDVAVTRDGFKIIEINSVPGLNRSSNPWDVKLNNYFSRLLIKKGIKSKNGF
jgi:hypothetical protein